MRQKNIDILKSIGLICIILAHVNPPKIIFQARNFDVILMIIISSYLFFCSSSTIDSFSAYIQYVWKRVKRLLFPTWIFLTLYFLLNTLFNIQTLNFKVILSSYLLGNRNRICLDYKNISNCSINVAFNEENV